MLLYKHISNEKWPVKAGTAAEMGPKSGTEISAFMWTLDLGVSVVCVFESPMKGIPPLGFKPSVYHH
jgi:hypothetical protein